MRKRNGIGRREFLKGGAGLFTLPFVAKACKPSERKKLTILHSNDMHSHIEPFPEDDPDHPGEGGMARRAELVDRIRKEGQDPLLLDSGDIFQGTPYFNEYGGELEFRLMSMMGYDASTLGNHDFDKGTEHLAGMMEKEGKFPFINTNYDLKGTPLEERVQKSRIIEKNGARVGIVGAGIDLKGLVNPVLTEGVEYHDPVEALEQEAERLKKSEGCGPVIALSHLGDEYEDGRISDLKLAQNTRHLDLILGGHTHRFFERPKVLRNLNKKPVIVNQVGWAGLRLGRIDLEWNEQEGLESVKAGILAVKKEGRVPSRV